MKQILIKVATQLFPRVHVGITTFLDSPVCTVWPHLARRRISREEALAMASLMDRNP